MFAKKSIFCTFSVLFVIVFMLAIAPLGAALAAGVRYAKPAASGSGDCLSWDNACTLQTALTGATSGNEIWVMQGTHIPTTTADRAATFQLKSGVAVYGGFAGTETTRSQRNPAANLTTLSGDLNGDDVGFTNNAENVYHVVTGATGATLDGFTIKAGNANGASDPTSNGGGVYDKTASPTLANITFSGNAANYGSGMYNDTSRPMLTNVTFSGNAGTGSYSRGGGMYNYGSAPTLASATFSGNSAESGGGMYNASSAPTLTNATFSGNSSTGAYASGGGMYNEGSSPTLLEVTFSGNTAYNAGGGMSVWSYGNPKLTNVTFENNSATNTTANGGGIYLHESNLTLTNVTLSGNWALNNGGGMYAQWDGNGSPTLTNVTFSGNTAYNNGGGIYNEYSAMTLTNVTLSNNSALRGGGMYNHYDAQIRNTIFWGNTATIDGAQIYYLAGPLTVSDSVVQDGCPAGSTCTNIIPADPALGALGNDGGFTQTIPLLVNSSAIDTGNDTVCPTTDQRGVPRPQGAHCDIGAYELDDIAPVVSSITRVNPSPTNLAIVNFTVTFSEPEVGVDGSDFSLTSAGVSGAFVSGLSGSGKIYTVAVNTGSGSGAIRLDLPASATIADLAGNPLAGLPYTNGASYTINKNVTPTPTPKTVIFQSAGAYDGWVLESSENSKVGGTMNSNAATFNLGDNAAKKQYRGILSFSTGAGLPDNAVVTAVTLKVKQQAIVGGGNPLTTFRGFMVDIKNGFFGTSAALQASDFQATTSHAAYGPFNPALAGGWYSINLTGAKAYINKLGSGLTQIRLRFNVDDNNNAIANYLSLYSGNAPAASRPQLIIKYDVP